jgi:hypothetical protein
MRPSIQHQHSDTGCALVYPGKARMKSAKKPMPRTAKLAVNISFLIMLPPFCVFRFLGRYRYPSILVHKIKAAEARHVTYRLFYLFRGSIKTQKILYRKKKGEGEGPNLYS